MGAFLAGVANRVAVCRGTGGVDVTISLIKAVSLGGLCFTGVANSRGRMGDDGAASRLGTSRYVLVTGAALLDISGDEGCAKRSFAFGLEGAAESGTAFSCILLAIGVLAIWNASRPSLSPFLGAVEGTIELDGTASN